MFPPKKVPGFLSEIDKKYAVPSISRLANPKEYGIMNYYNSGNAGISENINKYMRTGYEDFDHKR